MRNISVSTEVFAAIWAQRKQGEATEDAILGRILLGLERFSFEPEPGGRRRSGSGEMRIEEYDLRLPPASRYSGPTRENSTPRPSKTAAGICRTTAGPIESLHRLSWAVVRRGENAWKYWNYKRRKGTNLKHHAVEAPTIWSGREAGIDGSAMVASSLDLSLSAPVSP